MMLVPAFVLAGGGGREMVVLVPTFVRAGGGMYVVHTTALVGPFRTYHRARDRNMSKADAAAPRVERMRTLAACDCGGAVAAAPGKALQETRNSY